MLIPLASSSRAPVAPVFFTRSDPAKSTRLSVLLDISRTSDETSIDYVAFLSILTIKTAWLRDDAMFI
jgi:hypothetical protein